MLIIRQTDIFFLQFHDILQFYFHVLSQQIIKQDRHQQKRSVTPERHALSREWLISSALCVCVCVCVCVCEQLYNTYQTDAEHQVFSILLLGPDLLKSQ